MAGGGVRRPRSERVGGMYTTCLFCGARLGTNEAVEAFPVGRRLAFDAAKGRLWVVCRKCERWNLSPLEERWEAIEACEKLYRSAKLKASTDNIGLATTRDGTALVRVGRPERRELAAWRYGDQFKRRFRRMFLTSAAFGAGGPIVYNLVGGAGLAVALPVGIVAFQLLPSLLVGMYQQRRVIARVENGRGDELIVRHTQAWSATLVPGEGSSPWGLRLRHDRGVDVVQGEAARFAAGRVMASVNVAGAQGKGVRAAVDLLEDAGGPERMLTLMSRRGRPGGDTMPRGLRLTPMSDAPKDALVKLPEADRLALEMALHEESERRAMEGELAELEGAWREAERIAAIADRLLVPAEVEAKLGRGQSPGSESGL